MWLVAYMLWIPRLWISFYGTMFLWKYVYLWTSFLWNYVFIEIRLRMTKQVFITSFKVSYQPSDLREVMFWLKGTYDCKYETVGDFGRSLPPIPLCLRALVRHRAHMNKFDKFSQNNFHEVFLWMCVMLFCFLMNVYTLYKYSCTCWAKAHVVCSCYRRQGACKSAIGLDRLKVGVVFLKW